MNSSVKKLEKISSFKLSKKICKTSIVMYSISMLLVIYSIYIFINCYKYISNMVATKQLTIAGNEYTVISYYMNNFGQYIMFAIVIVSIGIIIQKLDDLNPKKVSFTEIDSIEVMNENNKGIKKDDDSATKKEVVKRRELLIKKESAEEKENTKEIRLDEEEKSDKKDGFLDFLVQK